MTLLLDLMKNKHVGEPKGNLEIDRVLSQSSIYDLILIKHTKLH